MIMSLINYPPEEIINPPPLEKKNFEHIILWMLYNNEECEWSDFTNDPVNISLGTLSKYLKSLEIKGFLDRIRRGLYRITANGEERYNELSQVKKEERRLSYPPDLIKNSRNYDHIILWMVYNNNFCRWSDFLEEPLRINQSQLSKNLNILMDKNYVKKEDKEYKITQAGKLEYSSMLKYYDLDRQSILKEESRRIEEMTKNTIKFFEKFHIEDDDLKFRFLNNVLKLNYEKVKDLLSQEDFNKVLLYLSINHPNEFPNYVSPSDFSEKYNIKEIDLKFFVDKIVDEKFYQIKFFKLKATKERYYYFQADEKLEKVLSAITEDHITKFTYLNKLYEKSLRLNYLFDMKFTINSILDEVCENLFQEGLKGALKTFMPEYVNYLAYKIETKRELVDTIDKLEGVAWRNIPEVFQSYSYNEDIGEQFYQKYYVDLNILKILKIFEDANIKDLFEKTKSLMKHKQYEYALEKVNSDIEADPENLNLVFLKAIILSLLNRHQEAIDYLKVEVKKDVLNSNQDTFVSYHLIIIFCEITLGRFNRALEISEKFKKQFPDHPISHINRALILGYKIIYQLDLEEIRIDDVLLDIDKAINLDSNKSNKAKYYDFKGLILRQSNKFEEALEAINKAIELDPNDIKLYLSKYKILYSDKRFNEAFEFIDEAIEKFPEQSKDLLIHKAYIFKNEQNYNEGLRIINELRKQYPNDLDLLNNELYWYLYQKDKKNALEKGKLLVELDPEDGNFHDSYAEILTEFGEYEEAIKEIKKAIKLEPHGWFTFNSYLNLAKCYKGLGKFNLARESLKKGETSIRTCFCDIDTRIKWRKHAEKILDEMDAKS